MITQRSMNAAKRNSDIPPEQCPYFMEALRSRQQWILRNGKWRPRKPCSEERKEKLRNYHK